jgi:hypothetical protein
VEEETKEREIEAKETQNMEEVEIEKTEKGGE